MKNITVREWIEKFNHGEFDNEDFKTQCDAGWYDWFCSTKTLAKKLKKWGTLLRTLKMITFLIIFVYGSRIIVLAVIHCMMILDLNP